ncbi:NAD(P)H oxidoreductase [Gracilibacillus phocaeensis]|uniref:NAD(P)H oxidoreductase n=1 Tax=Gracilibacillus phocaeensis TaxID=2042304 RepID=UPI00102F4AD2|nr:NAD(P)H oxidoreductase [Gracilibacillus phocaeensis]
MKVLAVITHPRTNSLTFQVSNHFIKGLKEAGHEVTTLDLYRSGFNPVLYEADEPNWKVEHQQYSAETEKQIAQMKNHDALAFIFPLWWWSMPAMLKGYIDRVWNYGFAYGSNKLKHQHVLWLSLAGAPITRFEKRKYDKMMTHYFNIGLADYCGIPNSKFELFYNTINVKPGYVDEWFNKAYKLGFNYGKD